MKTIWEKEEDDDRSNGGCRSSALSPETNLKPVKENKSLFKLTGVTIVPEAECNSSSSSSIGNDSDGAADVDGEDVESRYDDDNNQNGNGFDDAIQALEQALPIRRGISTFYNGKSKSFTCLAADVWPTSSVEDIAKPENAYTRKRRNLGAFKLSSINTCRIQKKPKTSKLINFTIDREDPGFTKHHATRPQINRPLALRSFSMVNLH